MVDTGDIDLLVDTRGGLRFVVSDEIAERSLLTVLRSVDKSFEKSAQPYRAQNSEGYMVDLIKPMRNPPWNVEASQIGNYNDNLTASETAGLVWLENAPAFEATVIDEKGYPLAIAAADPRVWAAHKLWVSRRADREPVKRQRDEQQAIAAATIVATFFPHLPYVAADLKMLPLEVYSTAAPLFEPPASRQNL